MRPLIVSVCCLLVLPLGCESSGEDPQAAARAAQSAAGGLKHAKPLDPGSPTDPGKVIRPEEGKLPPRGGGDVKPPPSVAGATCVVDDDDDPADHPGGGHDQKGPGKVIKPGTIEKPDVKTPQVEGAVPKSAKTDPKAIGGRGKPGPKGTKALARSTDGSGSRSTVDGPLPDWSTMCASAMGADECETLCRAEGKSWDSDRAVNGTCYLASKGDSGTSTTQCGCWCK